MRLTAIRIAVIAVCVGGIAGMIVTSATNHNGAAITFGIVTAVAVLCQMVATTVSDEHLGMPGAPVTGWPSVPETQAAALEEQITSLVGAGADEAAVRDLVRRAVRLGRGTPPSAYSSDS